MAYRQDSIQFGRLGIYHSGFNRAIITTIVLPAIRAMPVVIMSLRGWLDATSTFGASMLTGRLIQCVMRAFVLASLLFFPSTLSVSYLKTERSVLLALFSNTSLGFSLNRLMNDSAIQRDANSRIAFDVLQFADAHELNVKLLAMGASLARYSAMFSNMHNMARVLQLRAPEVPLVFEGLSDPVARCLVDTLNVPGRNATGYMHYLPSQLLKQMETLRDGFIGRSEHIVIVSGDNVLIEDCHREDNFLVTPPAGPCKSGEHLVNSYIRARLPADQLITQAKRHGHTVRFVVLCNAAEIEGLARWVTRPSVTGWIVPWHGLFYSNINRLVEVLNATKLPAVYPFDGFARVGGNVVVTPILDRGTDRASFWVLQRILQGEDPSGMPVQSPRGFSIIVNARTGDALGIRPSLHLLRIADEIIH